MILVSVVFRQEERARVRFYHANCEEFCGDMIDLILPARLSGDAAVERYILSKGVSWSLDFGCLVGCKGHNAY